MNATTIPPQPGDRKRRRFACVHCNHRLNKDKRWWGEHLRRCAFKPANLELPSWALAVVPSSSQDEPLVLDTSNIKEHLLIEGKHKLRTVSCSYCRRTISSNHKAVWLAHVKRCLASQNTSAPRPRGAPFTPSPSTSPIDQFRSVSNSALAPPLELNALSRCQRCTSRKETCIKLLSSTSCQLCSSSNHPCFFPNPSSAQPIFSKPGPHFSGLHLVRLAQHQSTSQYKPRGGHMMEIVGNEFAGLPSLVHASTYQSLDQVETKTDTSIPTPPPSTEDSEIRVTTKNINISSLIPYIELPYLYNPIVKCTKTERVPREQGRPRSDYKQTHESTAKRKIVDSTDDEVDIPDSYSSSSKPPRLRTHLKEYTLEKTPIASTSKSDFPSLRLIDDRRPETIHWKQTVRRRIIARMHPSEKSDDEDERKTRLSMGAKTFEKVCGRRRKSRPPIEVDNEDQVDKEDQVNDGFSSDYSDAE
ncbi:hypothetical protein HDU79_006138 [Rhizoclosmatium sp. JEL0117]|nr:hypothetical protein HDU79_006138 [Rhizoclosmatium sp. JEL0117]